MKQTAMQIMYDELLAHEYTIPLGFIVKCQELIEIEKEQNIDFARKCLDKAKDLDVLTAFLNTEHYYNETFNQIK